MVHICATHLSAVPLLALLVGGGTGAALAYPSFTGAEQNAPGPKDNREPGSPGFVPNVVIFYIDDVGTDLLAMYDSINPYSGSTDPRHTTRGGDGIYLMTPTLERLAMRGVQFLNAYATPSCSPGRASLLTGHHPSRTGVGIAITDEHVGTSPGALAEFGDPGYELPTLAELLQSVDGSAGVIGKWHLGLLGEDYLGWDGISIRGHWDDVRCVFANFDSPPHPPLTGWDRRYYNFLWYENGTTRRVTDTYATSHQIDAALTFCLGAQEPFVAYVAPNAAHTPLIQGNIPPISLVSTESYLRGEVEKIHSYSATVEALDSEIGRFLDELGPALLNRTVIIVMGDNGTPPQVMASLASSPPHTGASGLYDLGPVYSELISEARFKRTVFEKGIRVPLIVSGPGVIAPGRQSTALVEVVDIFATVADLVEADQEWTSGIDGISFRKVLEDPATTMANHDRQTILVERFVRNGNMHESVLDGSRVTGFSAVLPGAGRFKVIRRYAVESGFFEDELYLLEDLSGQGHSDPWEVLDNLNDPPLQPGDRYFPEYHEMVERLDPLEAIPFCVGSVHSGGEEAEMEMLGTHSVTANDLFLRASPIPSDQVGFFLYALLEAPPPYVAGESCLESSVGGRIFRLPPVMGQNGALTTHLDFAALPSTGEILSGSIWRFQAWFRDPAPAAGFGLSNGLSIYFTP
jgi:arylsulfatase A-like enzyme